MAKRKNGGGRSSRERRGKSESMTGKKEGAVETRQAIAKLEIADGDKIKHWMAAVKGTKEKITTINGQLRNIYKQAKADHVPKAVLDELLALERGDPNVFRAELETLAVGLRGIGAPFQLNVFDTAYGSPVEAAAARGRQDAEANRFAENTYPEGSEEATAYQRAYMKVQAGRVNGGSAAAEADEDDAPPTPKASKEQRQPELAH